MFYTDKNIIKKGIDVSYANGKINWDKMKDNIDFVIIRCGYGGDFVNQDDAQWLANVTACEQRNIPYGVYLYSYATTKEKANHEATHALRLLEGHKPDYPVFLDLEESRIASQGRDKILEIAEVFCKRITDAGYVYGTYANKYWFDTLLDHRWYNEHPKWLAQYNRSCTYKGSYDIWQYTDKGRIPGFSCNFDMNYCYTSFEKGDTDNDGKVTTSDAREILRTAAGIDIPDSLQAQRNADVDGDGDIDTSDARKALRKAAGVE